jgi:hypothetical protein
MYSWKLQNHDAIWHVDVFCLNDCYDQVILNVVEKNSNSYFCV